MSRRALLLASSLSGLVLFACDSGGIIDSDGGASSTSSATATSGKTTSVTSSTVTSTGASPTTTVSSGTGGAPGWPTCDSQPAGSATKTIPEVWVDDPMFPTAVWMQGLYVTAVARGGCVATQSCTIFVQQDESYVDLVDAQQKSIPIGIAPTVAEHFTGIKAGDRVDVYGSVFRNTQDGQNELFMLVTDNLPGCAKVVGTGNPQPVDATLDDLTTPNYEANGPVFVTLTGVTGKPQTPDVTFALWDTALGPMGTIEEVTSLSPFFLSGAVFTGLTTGMLTNFSSVTGVFAVFAPAAVPLIKYEEIYPRDMTEAPHN